MFGLCQAITDQLAWILILYVLFCRITPKNLGDITSILLKNKSYLVFFLEKEYLSEGTNAFNIELIKLDR